MQLLRVELDNFRCFRRAEFNLTSPTGPLPLVLLVGGNGSGKTSFLHAIAGVFTQFGQYNADPLVPADVMSSKDYARVTLKWRDMIPAPPGPDESVILEAEAHAFAKTQSFRGTNVAPGSSVTKMEPRDRFAAWQRHVVDPTPRSTGLIVALDLFRFLPPTKVAGPNISQVVTHRCENSMTPTIRRGGALAMRFEQLKQWIVNLDSLRARAKADRGVDLAMWKALGEALNTLLSPNVFEAVDERWEVWFRSPSGRVPLEALSDGYRSLFVIVTEMLLRLSLATPDPTKVLEQEAVCLIDEIDAHLHPALQEAILPGLRKLFPRVQFIATTHSPYIVASAQPENVFRLEQEKEMVP